MVFQPDQTPREGGPYAPRVPVKKEKKKSGWGGPIGLGFFALFWSVIVLIFDGVIGYGLFKNYQAQDYPETRGVVTSSRIASHSDSDGTTYRADIKYRYEVSGQSYTSDQHAYGTFGSSDRSLAKKAVRKFPAGREVAVYYNPADPEDAVLDRSFESVPWFIFLFLTPFNLIMLGLWGAVGHGVWRSLFGKEEGTLGGYEVVSEGFTTRVKIGQGNPLVTGAIGVGIASFISIFPIAFMGLTDNMTALIGAVIFMAVLGVVGLVWQIHYNASEKGDLVIDRTNMQLIVPGKSWGEPTTLNMTELDTVGVKNISGSKGSVQYAPTVTYMDKHHIRQEVLICQWSEKAAAHELADWLRQELGLQLPG